MAEEYDTYKAEVLSEPSDEQDRDIFQLAVMGRFKDILSDSLKYHNEESLDAFLDMDTQLANLFKHWHYGAYDCMEDNLMESIGHGSMLDYHDDFFKSIRKYEEISSTPSQPELQM